MSARRFTRPLAAGLVVIVAACGHGTTTGTQFIDSGVKSTLRQDLRSVAIAIAAHRVSAAHAALLKLDGDLAHAYAAGAIGAARYAAIVADSAALGAQLMQPAPTVTATVAAPTPPATTANRAPDAASAPHHRRKGGHHKGGSAAER